MDGPRITTGSALAALVTLLLLAIPADPAASQRPGAHRESGRGEIGRGFFQAGYIGLDLDELDAALAAAGYPSLDHGFFTLGGAGYGTRGRLLVGGEGHRILESTETTPDGTHRLSLSGGYVLLGLQAGYTFAPGDTSWQLDGINDVAGGPDLRSEGFWVRLSVGGWGRAESGGEGRPTTPR